MKNPFKRHEHKVSKHDIKVINERDCYYLVTNCERCDKRILVWNEDTMHSHGKGFYHTDGVVEWLPIVRDRAREYYRTKRLSKGGSSE